MYFVFLDFEATCLSDRLIENQEIIEFPMIVYRDTEFVAEFHSYVRPVYSEISEFCTELTGISPETVSDAPEFREVYRAAIAFLDNILGTGDEVYTFITCGDWDLKKMLPKQCKLSGTSVHPYFKVWRNARREFEQKFPGIKFSNLKDMLRVVSLKFEGRLHSGIDDAKNIARLFFAMHN